MSRSHDLGAACGAVLPHTRGVPLLPSILTHTLRKHHAFETTRGFADVPATFIFRVEAEGGVPVLSGPSVDATPVGRRAQGDYVRGLELRHGGTWLKVRGGCCTLDGSSRLCPVPSLTAHNKPLPTVTYGHLRSATATYRYLPLPTATYRYLPLPTVAGRPA